ncbi:MAG: hypothetical protein VW518_06225, partial [Burkholderiaceae bacterium]
MNYFTFNEVLRLSATGHVDVVNVFKVTTTVLAHLVVSMRLHFVTMDDADFESATAHTTFVGHNPHEDGVTANHLLDTIKRNLLAFRVNEVFFDQDEESVIHDIEVILNFMKQMDKRLFHRVFLFEQPFWVRQLIRVRLAHFATALLAGFHFLLVFFIAHRTFD